MFTSNVTVYAESAPLPADPAKQVTITIKGSAHVTVSSPATIVGVKAGQPGETTWGSIKAQAQAKLSFTPGWVLDGWKKDSASGAPMHDSDTFASDTHVFAVAKNTAAPPPPPPPAGDKAYTAQGVPFTMKKIDSPSFGTYYLGETEVTQKLWHKVMGSNPSDFQGPSKLPEATEHQRERPVEKVTWYECIAFCNRLTVQAGMAQSECVYYSDGYYTRPYTAPDAAAKKLPHVKESAKGFRLPKQLEWEWAAKGGTNNKWAGTNDEGDLLDYAWYLQNSGFKTHEVKKKKPNEYGLYDMSGNVGEWCWDQEDAKRVRRGGSFRSAASDVTCTWRDSDTANRGHNAFGLRVLCK